eukprot:Amastigsp_a349286_5.p2 type:complete len:141 gc:universal Amastigsp_a349286_5:486-64(-)
MHNLGESKRVDGDVAEAPHPVPMQTRFGEKKHRAVDAHLVHDEPGRSKPLDVHEPGRSHGLLFELDPDGVGAVIERCLPRCSVRRLVGHGRRRRRSNAFGLCRPSCSCHRRPQTTLKLRDRAHDASCGPSPCRCTCEHPC